MTKVAAKNPLLKVPIARKPAWKRHRVFKKFNSSIGSKHLCFISLQPAANLLSNGRKRHKSSKDMHIREIDIVEKYYDLVSVDNEIIQADALKSLNLAGQLKKATHVNVL